MQPRKLPLQAQQTWSTAEALEHFKHAAASAGLGRRPTDYRKPMPGPELGQHVFSGFAILKPRNPSPSRKTAPSKRTFWSGTLSLCAASSIMSRVSSTTCEQHFQALRVCDSALSQPSYASSSLMKPLHAPPTGLGTSESPASSRIRKVYDDQISIGQTETCAKKPTISCIRSCTQLTKV